MSVLRMLMGVDKHAQTLLVVIPALAVLATVWQLTAVDAMVSDYLIISWISVCLLVVCLYKHIL